MAFGPSFFCCQTIWISTIVLANFSIGYRIFAHLCLLYRERAKKPLVHCPLSSYFPFFVPCTQFQVSLPQFPISFPHPLFLGPLSTATLSFILCFPSSVLFSLFPSYSALSPIFLISPFLISFPSSFPPIVSIHHPFFPVSVDFTLFSLFAISPCPVFCPLFSVSWKKS